MTWVGHVARMCRGEGHTEFGGEMYRGENILKTYA